MKLNDAVSGAAFVVLAGGIFYATKDISVLPGQAYGGAFFPRVIATLMAVCGGWLIFIGLRQRMTAPSAEERIPWAATVDWMRSPRHAASFLIVLAALVFYILASDALGFLLTGFIILYGLLLWLRGPSTFVSSAVIAAVSVLAMQQFFGQFLRVPLPWGPLQPFAW